MKPFGLINLNKPSGITSRDAVDVVVRAVRPAKAGHAGTLDPLASGVLVVAVGQATRLIEYVQQATKRYTATFRLGGSSPSDDVETEVEPLVDPPIPTPDQLAAAIPHFLGRTLQKPPAYSALKVAGRRAYQLARDGQPPELEPRPIHIYELSVVSYDYPDLTLDVACAAGTYIRALGRDLALRLGTAAVMTALTRTAVGAFTLEDAIAPSEVTRHRLRDLLLPASRAVAQLPSVTLSEDEVARVHRGLEIPDRFQLDFPDEPTEAAALDSTGRLVAILAPPRAGAIRATRNFNVAAK